eukprot:UN31052
MTKPETRLKYVTDGILVFEAVNDLLLNKYSVVILDEAHERAIFNDLLFGICRDVCVRRPKDFKLIVMSATLDMDKFLNYFPKHHTQSLHINVRNFPVKELFRCNKLTNRRKQDVYIPEIFEILKCIEKQSKSGDVLVFLPGAQEINTCVDRCRNRFKK